MSLTLGTHYHLFDSTIILGAVLEISAVSATFSRNFSGFWAEPMAIVHYDN